MAEECGIIEEMEWRSGVMAQKVGGSGSRWGCCHTSRTGVRHKINSIFSVTMFIAVLIVFVIHVFDFLTIFGVVMTLVGRFEAAKNACSWILSNEILFVEVVKGQAFKKIRFDGAHDVERGLELVGERMTLLVV